MTNSNKINSFLAAILVNLCFVPAVAGQDEFCDQIADAADIWSQLADELDAGVDAGLTEADVEQFVYRISQGVVNATLLADSLAAQGGRVGQLGAQLQADLYDLDQSSDPETAIENIDYLVETLDAIVDDCDAVTTGSIEADTATSGSFETDAVTTGSFGTDSGMTARAAGAITVGYQFTESYGAVAEMLAATGVFKEIAQMVSSVIALPTDLPVVFQECNEPNAFYHPGLKQVIMCYEFFDLFASTFTETAETQEELLESVIGTGAFFYLHELGHAIVDLLDIPITGREEDSVDTLAALILLHSGDASSVFAAIQNFGAMAALTEAQGLLASWGEHSFDSQRMYDTACLVFGSDPETYAAMVGPDGLPAERAARCPAEFEQKDRAWDQLLGPHYRESAQVAPEPAAGSFALTCIGTETEGDVNLQYRWGPDAPWQNGVVEPGQWLLLSYNYDHPGENQSPQLQISYDDDLSASENWVVTDLQSYSASEMNCEERGWTYNFYTEEWELVVRDEES